MKLKKYPYKEVIATITGIISLSQKQAHERDYSYNGNTKEQVCNHIIHTGSNDYVDYEYFYNQSQGINGIIREDRKTGKEYIEYSYEWFEYDVFVKYTCKDNNTYENKCHIISSVRLEEGNQINLCYLVDDPLQITNKTSYVKTIDEFYRNLFNLLFVLFFIIFMFIGVIFLLEYLPKHLMS